MPGSRPLRKVHVHRGMSANEKEAPSKDTCKPIHKIPALEVPKSPSAESRDEKKLGARRHSSRRPRPGSRLNCVQAILTIPREPGSARRALGFLTARGQLSRAGEKAAGKSWRAGVPASEICTPSPFLFPRAPLGAAFQEGFAVQRPIVCRALQAWQRRRRRRPGRTSYLSEGSSQRKHFALGLAWLPAARGDLLAPGYRARQSRRNVAARKRGAGP